MHRYFCIAVALSLASCGEFSPADAQPDVVEREGEPAVVVYPPGDDSMPMAISDARESVSRFIERLPALQSNADAYFSVKAPIPTGGDTEHIWLNPVTYEAGSFVGRLANEPLSPELSYGQEYSLRAEDISDWMAVVDGVLYGGYTIYVARDQLSPGQREQFESEMGFEMPPEPQGF